jgi:hypothetical protein
MKFFEVVAALYLIPVWIIAAISFRIGLGCWKFISIFQYAALIKSEDRPILFSLAFLLWSAFAVVVIVVPY